MSDPAQLLVEHLDIWTGAVEPKNGAGRGNGGKVSLYGIEKLRSLVLDLAVRGKLVPQDAADEPASALVKSLDQQSIDEAVRKYVSKYVNKGSLAPKDHPYKTPQSWEWVNVAKIGHSLGQSEPEAQFTYIDVGAIDQRAGRIIEPTILDASAAPSRARKIVKRGTLIYSTVRPYLLNIAIVDEDFDPQPIASTAFAIVHPFKGMDARFIYWVLRSRFFVEYVEGCQTGIAYPAINDKQFFGAPFPLPPLADQKRIVAKVDELMALCDALEAGTREAMAAHEKLVRELLATLVNSKDADDLATNWSRIETHFDTLFTTEESIEELKRIIQDLAVQGQLVRQSSSLDRANQRKLRADHDAESYDLKAFQDRAAKFALPKTWAIEPLSRVTSHIVDCPHTTPKWTDSGALCIKSEQIYPGHLDLTRPHYVSADTYLERIERLEPRANDILYKREGGILGVGAQIPENTQLCMGQRLMLLRANASVLPAFLELVINSPWIVDFAKERTTGGAAPRVNMAIVRAYPIPVPPLEEQKQILALVAKLDAFCEEARQGLSRASAVRALLADALTVG
jgi:type I restriction enzyme S subunit